MDIFGNRENLPGDKELRKINKKSELDFALLPEEKNESAPEQKRHLRFTYLNIGIVIVFIIIIVKLFLNQIVMGSSLNEMAQGNKIRPRVISATRGMILDANGLWLARNVPSFDLALYPSDLPKDKNKREEIYKRISELIFDNKDSIKKKAEENGLLSLDKIVLKENLPREEALLMEEKVNGLPGVFVAKRASREYKTVAAISHILGYTGKVSDVDLKEHPSYRFSDWIGKTGLELSYDEELRGDDGVEQIEVDSVGNIVRTLVEDTNREPEAGNNLQTYIDSDLQQKVAEFLSQGIESVKNQEGKSDVVSGTVIIMDVRNGGIKSMVSLPAYDDNLFAKGISSDAYKNLISDESKPMFNRATNGVYPPGSTIKIVMAAAGLSEGAIAENTSFDTPPAIEIGQWKFPDWKDHGVTNIEKAIAESNNIFFYSIGGGFDKINGIGIDKMKKWWQVFGLGDKTGIDLSSESSGLLPDPAWKKKAKNESWYIGDTYHTAIGQGDLLVTPLQMVRAVSAIANGGKLLKPQIVQKITDHDGNLVKEYGPIVQNPQVADPGVIRIVQEGMRMAVTSGSATPMLNLPVSVAGKTGTAQFFDNQKTHAWFECYAPYENPEIAVVVLVEGGGGGYEVAIPIAKNILNYYYTR